MSLGGGGTSDDNCGNSNQDALHKALCRSAQAGVTYVVAAGNWGANATGTVPAAYDDTLITVSALADSDGKPFGMGTSTSYGADDTFASFSNYGSIVDIGAPGADIFSTFKGGQYTKMSGTSMASPHVAGAAAAYIQANPSATWREVRDNLRALSYSLYSGHTDPLMRHSEPILNVNGIRSMQSWLSERTPETAITPGFVSKNLLRFQNRRR
jgi:subtilisin family serine protease